MAEPLTSDAKHPSSNPCRLSTKPHDPQLWCVEHECYSADNEKCSGWMPVALTSKASDDVEAVAARIFEQARVCDDASYVMVPRFLIGKLREAIKAHGIETTEQQPQTKDVGDLLMAITSLRQKAEDAEVLAKHVWDTATAQKASEERS